MAGAALPSGEGRGEVTSQLLSEFVDLVFVEREDVAALLEGLKAL